ncbi:putative selenate reductase [Austwickia chelonae]|uniref:Putative oxidoreductase n=1 Tax=Austwickia chelonae NBRC 105200 TaxID=1184607 RepID=K6W6T3_9MICO|nr:putative selenate reductase subunit YgfK [Austwickia chelonae]GAB77527.1 putative oxidoreductase [Austwickia chelonae NBRC 105200]SEW12201.1 putative selenate reductase [Austwickia chelonae]
MGDLMRPLSFDHLMRWAQEELRTDQSIFGVRRDHFWTTPRPRLIINAFGDRLALPLGPAAGPNTQMAHNILASYLAGARFMELKTVQRMDGEEIRHAVPKPCIDAQDEGYNCEWSTELTVPQAFEEYVRAYFAIAVLARECQLGSLEDIAFNISVGYDLDGIRSEKIDTYLNDIADASGTRAWQECHQWVEEHLPEFTYFTRDDLDRIDPRLSRSVTLSTLHGCPADEIERIAMHLLTEKGFNTFVKCNPTMLGYDYARTSLDRLGYEYLTFDDHHFVADLQFEDAVPMFHRLTAVAEERGLRFGVKLTNTFPVQVAAGELPAEEMYMSGRSLYVLSLSLAQKLSHAFDGKLPISFSGGIDAFNIAQVLRTGIQPVTVATTILKPGGVTRFNQLADETAQAMSDYSGIDVQALDRAVEDLFAGERYHKRWREKIRSRKTSTALPLTDCFKAPCEHGGCPVEQQIPEYLALTAAGQYTEAFSVIALDNTSPTITGVLCSEQCREHCTRLDYDISIDMRGVKLAAADGAQEEYIRRTLGPELRTPVRTAVIGAGPGGIAAAIFLRRNGMDVDVFEKLSHPYGIVSHIIPGFRIDREQIDRDYRLATSLGVHFHFDTDPAFDVTELKKNYGHVVVAIGAWGRGQSPVREGQEHILDALDFLWQTQNENGHEYGRRIAVIGAGDVAMDCVRTATRLPGVETAELIYRRTEPFMPATQHEVNTVRAEGLPMHELLAPVSYDGTTLRVERMTLGPVDASGRRSVTGTGEYQDMPFDTVIGATGATVLGDDYTRNGIELDARRHPVVDEHLECTVPGVHVIGDGRRGPATIVQAIADAKIACRAILESEGIVPDYARPHPTVHRPPTDVHARRGLMIAEINGRKEGERCLTCQDICEICTEVCPNRANVALAVPGFADSRQIVHIDGLCNECNTCGTFCPHAGLPYKDKLTVFWEQTDFEDSTNPGFLHTGGRTYLVRLPGGDIIRHDREQDTGAADPLTAEMAAVLDQLEGRYSYLLTPTAKA